MKAGFNQHNTMKWFLTTVASSDKLGGKFSQLVEAEGWDCNNVDLKVVLNDIEFENVADVFQRMHDHMEKQNEEINNLKYKLEQFNKVKELMREDIEREIKEGSEE